MDTIAVVVTYNRKSLLEECLQAILAQSMPVKKIIVINNASTDGTEKLFEEGGIFDRPDVECATMDSNLGGAGGFCEGVRIAAKEKCDWVWIMDDDTIPTEHALAEFSNAAEAVKKEKVSFLASSVFGTEGEPMNVPVIDGKASANGYQDWYEYLEHSMVRIKAATFVSILVSIDAIHAVGVPFKDYFLWGDDIEYTQRLVKYYGTAYMCGKSKVIHKRLNAKALSIFTEENKNRAGMYFYYFRNYLINFEEYRTKKELYIRILRFFGKSFKTLVKPGVKYRWVKFCAVQKGVWDFILRRYDYKKFKNRIGNMDI